MIGHTVLVVVLLCATARALEKIALKLLPSNERIFVEAETGRQVIFHGVNAIVKGFPYVPSTDEWDIDVSLVEKDHRALESLGVNVYRLGAMWKGAQPTPDKFNSTYFDQLRLITEAAAKHGIYTLLDMHQDVISEAVCGEGLPDWAVNLSSLDPSHAFPAPLEAPYTATASDGFPTRQDCSKYNWPSYYHTYANGRIFEDLYNTSSSLLPAWANFWAQVAQELGSIPSILGYELINEPWSGDTVSNPRLLLPGVGDRERLQPAYDILATAIRAKDSSSLLFFAAVTWDDIVPVGFDHAPGGPTEAGHSVLAFHYYTPPQANPQTYFQARQRDAQRLSVGMFLTEFERAEDNDDIDDDAFVSTAQAADSRGISWAMWEYKAFCRETSQTATGTSQAADYGACKTGYGGRELWDEDGRLKTPAAKKLARTYAPRVAGRVRKMVFDASTADFVLAWEVDADIRAPTEIFLHEDFHYPHGFDVVVQPEHKARWIHAHTNRLHVWHTDQAVSGDLLLLRIRAL